MEPAGLAAARLTSHLTRLCGRKPLPQTGVDELASLLPQLHRCLLKLDLCDGHICADGARALAAPLHRLTALTALHLASNDIGADGARALAAPLGGLTALAALHLGGNGLAKAAARAALGSAACPIRAELITIIAYCLTRCPRPLVVHLQLETLRPDMFYKEQEWPVGGSSRSAA